MVVMVVVAVLWYCGLAVVVVAVTTDVRVISKFFFVQLLNLSVLFLG